MKHAHKIDGILFFSEHTNKKNKMFCLIPRCSFGIAPEAEDKILLAELAQHFHFILPALKVNLITAAIGSRLDMTFAICKELEARRGRLNTNSFELALVPEGVMFIPRVCTQDDLQYWCNEPGSYHKLRSTLDVAKSVTDYYVEAA